MARMCSGPVRQQPPIQSAPASRHCSSHVPESMGFGSAGPAAGFRNPGFAGVGVDGDALRADSADLPDERQDVARRGAVDADGDDLSSRHRVDVEQVRAFLDRFAMSGVAVVAAGETDVCGEFRVAGQSFEDGFGFGERRDGFEREEVGLCLAHGGDAFVMEGDQPVMADVVAAVELCPVVQRRSIRAERTCNPDGARPMASGDFGLRVFAACPVSSATLCWIAERAACSATGAARPIS